MGIMGGCSLSRLRGGGGGAPDLRMGIVAGGGKPTDPGLGRRPLPPVAFFRGDSGVASPTRIGMLRMIPELRRRFSLLGHRGPEIRRGVEARLLLRQLKLWSIQSDRRRVRIRLIATRRWVAHLPFAGFRWGAL